jgi:peroxiredoxin
MLRCCAALLCSLLGSFALAGSAAAQIGSPPPELLARRWLNSPPWSLEELRGKAVYVVCFRTWSEECATQVPALSAKFEKDQKNGLVVLGVSSEPVDVLLPWVRLHQPRYPIVSLEGEEFERALGVQGHYFPIEAVIDPEGTLTYSAGLSSSTAESKLAEALDKASKGPLWPKRLDKAQAQLASGQYDKAYVEAKKLDQAQLSEEEARARGKLVAHLESLALACEEEARRLLDKNRVYEAHLRIAPIARCEPPFPNGADAREFLAALEALPDFKNEMKAGQLFVEAQELELVWNHPKAVEQYRAIAKKYDKLKIAAAVADRLAELRSRNMLIYVRDCEECLQAQKACAKHTEPVPVEGEKR